MMAKISIKALKNTGSMTEVFEYNDRHVLGGKAARLCIWLLAITFCILST